MTMIERIARAMCARDTEGRSYEYYSDDFKAMALAAIEAMREPTTQMRSAACAAAWYRNDQWKAMIDEALKAP